MKGCRNSVVVNDKFHRTEFRGVTLGGYTYTITWHYAILFLFIGLRYPSEKLRCQKKKKKKKQKESKDFAGQDWGNSPFWCHQRSL